MKKITLSMLLLVLSVLVASAQESEVRITTTLPEGTEFTFNPTLVNNASTVYVDWGDGQRVQEEMQTNSWGGNIGFVGTVKGEEIHIYGKFQRIDLKGKQITSCKLVAQGDMTYFSISDNLLEHGTLDLSGAPNLQTLDVSKNNLMWLLLQDFYSLESLYASGNPILNSVLLCDEGTKQEAIKVVNLADCDLTHFWPRDLPNLTMLNLSNNSLWDIEIADHYPSLFTLNLGGNTYLESVDVTKCPELAQLTVSNTAIKDLNISQNPELQYLYADNTGITKLSLANNNDLRTINLSNTGITTLDVSQVEALRNVYVDNTALRRLDLRMKRYLNEVSIAGTEIEWLDMHHCVGYNTLKKLDLRNCKRMTKQTLNFTFDAMPVHNGASYQPNVLLEGTAYEHANTGLLDVDGDNYFMPDHEGDGRNADLKEQVTLTDLTTGGGTYRLQQQGQWSDGAGDMPEWGSFSQYLPFLDVTSKQVWAGRPLRVVDVKAPEGYEFIGLEVNGEFIADNEFQLSEDGTVKVVFSEPSSADVIRLTVPAGAEQQYFLAADEEGTSISIDWGDGMPVEYTIGTTPKYIGVEDGQSTSGTTVTIKGAVTYADFASYPYVATDNMITDIDISKATHLRHLDLYMNEILGLDVSGLADLEYLDCSYCELDELNIANNPKLTVLRCYGNYLETLDLSTAPALHLLDAHNNMLDELDLKANPLIDTLRVQNNYLTALDIAHLTQLQELAAQSNQIEAIDLTNAPNLLVASLNENKLSKLDISQNPYLCILSVQANDLDGLDASQNPWLYSLNVSNNGWDECTLNDLYESLGQYPLTDEQKQEAGITVNLRVNSFYYGNAYPSNKYAASKTSVAAAKGWTLDYEGDGTGCGQVVSAIDAATIGGASFAVTNGEVVISAPQAVNVAIYSASGALLFADSVDATVAVGLPRGVYVCKAGNETRTLVVK